MKTKILHVTALALLVAGAAQAQYFQRMYGTASQDFLESGITLATFPQGYAMTGYTTGTTAAGNTLMVTRTDLAGTIVAAPSFNNSYPIFGPTGLVSARGRRIVEFPTTAAVGQFAVWGDFNTPTAAAPTDYFYALLNGNGTMAAGMPRSYSFAFTGATAVEATSMTVSAVNPSRVYVCGNASFTNTGTLPVVMCLDAGTGNIVWAWVYRPPCVTAVRWTATDLVESPFPSTSTSPEVFIVGRYDVSTNGNGDGCMFTVNGGTGAVASGLFIYGTATADEGLNAIEIANNPIGSGPGFAVAGFAQDPLSAVPTYNSWAMKLNATGTAADWSSILRYSIANTDDFANDIIERLNTFNQWEYYVGAYTTVGVFGGNDAVVYKLNAGGIVVGGGQLTYGGQGAERALQLGQYNNAPSNGLSIFGTTQGSFPGLGATEFYNVKAYFNGVTACNVHRITIPTAQGPTLLPKVNIDISQPLVASTLQSQMTPVNNALICTAQVIAGGSNARLAEEEEPTTAPSGVKVFPNPVSPDQALVTVAFDEAVTGGKAEIEVWNTLGQLHLQKTLTLAEGATQVDVELGSRLAPGIYHFVIRYNSKVQDFQVTVQ